MVAVMTCIFWGSLSGSGPATTAAVGMILLAPMIKHGYSKSFAGATIANAADLSIILPPEYRLHYLRQYYQCIGERPFRGRHHSGSADRRRHRAGGLPGLPQKGLPGCLDAVAPAAELWQAFKKSIWALLAPVVILGGIYSGIFTPTEAAVVAVFYSLFVAVFIYRSIQWRDMIDMLVDAAVTSSVIMFIVVFAGIFTWTASVIGVIDKAAQLIVSISPNAVVMIILIDLLLLALGMVLDAISISYLLMPILIPVLEAFGIDPVWYGVIFISALAVGQATPPVGVNLFTAANLIGSDVDAVAKEAIPYVIMDVIVLIILSLLPILSLYLPIKAGLYAP
jgi:C4-dicarboxylate transporter DctM subunit